MNLNTRKCEVVVFASDSHAPYPECKIAVSRAFLLEVQVSFMAKKPDGEHGSVEEGIKKDFNDGDGSS